MYYSVTFTALGIEQLSGVVLIYKLSFPVVAMYYIVTLSQQLRASFVLNTIVSTVPVSSMLRTLMLYSAKLYAFI